MKPKAKYLTTCKKLVNPASGLTWGYLVCNYEL